MKGIAFLISCGILISSCSGGSNENSNESSIGDSLENVNQNASNNRENIEVVDEVDHKDYEEFYESGALKIEGDFDENQARNGLWISYYEDGKKWSESLYLHGKKEGHSVTFFPNGKVRYIGEYKNDEKFGLWRFYDEAGELMNEETYQ